MDELISQITTSSGHVGEQVDKSTEYSHSSNDGLSKQEEDVEQLATAMNEMVASIDGLDKRKKPLKESLENGFKSLLKILIMEQ